MKNIGIITLFGDNFGNKLQNLAVQLLVEECGYNAQTIIDNSSVTTQPPNSIAILVKKTAPAHIVRALKSRFKNKYHYKNSTDGIIGAIIYAKKADITGMEKSRAAAFARFTDKYINIADFSIKLGKTDKQIDNYDYFVCGSDQVWNPTYASTTYIKFLQFAPQYKRIALSPSFGLTELPEYVKGSYAKWLNEIPYLSVREENGARIIKELTGREAAVLADPTICISKEKWQKIEKKPDNNIDGPYVLTYFLGNKTVKYSKYITKCAKLKNAAVVNLFDLRDKAYYNTSPDEFIYLIEHAQCVFTDSFHGTVFSLIMHTPFVVFDRMENGKSAMSTRIDTLLKSFNADDRRFSNLVKSGNAFIQDFSKSENVITAMKAKTMNFLSNALNTVREDEKECFVLENKEDCFGS